MTFRYSFLAKFEAHSMIYIQSQIIAQSLSDDCDIILQHVWLFPVRVAPRHLNLYDKCRPQYVGADFMAQNVSNDNSQPKNWKQ